MSSVGHTKSNGILTNTWIIASVREPLEKICRFSDDQGQLPSDTGQLSLRTIDGWDVCKSNRLHVDILRFPLLICDIFYRLHSNLSVNSLQSATSTGYFSNSTSLSVTNCRFSRSLPRTLSSCLRMNVKSKGSIPPATKAPSNQWMGRIGRLVQMNRLSMANDWLKFKMTKFRFLCTDRV